MATKTHLNIDVRISFDQLVNAVYQLSRDEKNKLISFLQEEDDKSVLITGIKEAVEEVNLAKKGKVKLKSARAFLNEL